jgi:hypothetical protein
LLAVIPVGEALTVDCVGETLPALMVNVLDVSGASPLADAVSVYPAPLLSMLKSENVATPATAGRAVVPVNAPPLGFAPIATVTAPVKLVAVLPNASRADTCTAGVIAAPAGVFPGCPVTASAVAAAALTVTDALVPAASEPDVATSV